MPDVTPPGGGLDQSDILSDGTPFAGGNVDTAVSESVTQTKEHDLRFLREMSRLFFDRSLDELNFDDGTFEIFTDTDDIQELFETRVGFEQESPLSELSFSGANINTVDTDPTGIAWKPDGTKMFEVGSNNKRVYGYDVSTPWDLNTIGTNGETLVTQNDSPEGIAWKPDGTKVFEVGRTGGKIYEYGVTTPWDISTASFQNTTFDTLGSSPTSLAWKPDGTKMFTSNKLGVINEYDVSTPWEIYTATFAGESLDVEDNAPGIEGIAWQPDGYRLYVIDRNSNEVYEYALRDPWEISTAFYTGAEFYTRGYNPSGLAWKPDGSKLFVVSSGSDGFNEYEVPDVEKSISPIFDTGQNGRGTLVVAWNLSNTAYTGVEFFPNTTNVTGIALKPDGTKLFTVDDTAREVREYELSNPWNLAAATDTGKTTFVTGFGAEDIAWKPDGSRLFISDTADNKLRQYRVESPWDITTAEDTGLNFTESSDSSGIFWKPDGTKVFTADRGNDQIREYEVGVPWKITTLAKIRSEPVVHNGLVDIAWKADGTTLLVLAENGTVIYEYDVAVPWDTSTIEFNGSTLDTASSSSQSISPKPDGTKLFTCTRDELHEYESPSVTPPAPFETLVQLRFAPSTIVVEDTTEGDLSVSYTITDTASNSVTVTDADVGAAVDASALTAGEQTIRVTLDTPSPTADDALVDFAVYFE